MNYIKNIKKFYPVLMLVIIVIAFLLRSPMFLHGDFYLLSDQGRDLQLVKQIVVDHKVPLIGAHAGIGGLFHGPLWLFMIVPFFLLSHGNPFWSLIPVYTFVSLAIVLGGFLSGWNLYNKYIGLVIAFFLSISQIFISTVSFTSNSQVMPLIFLCYLFALVKFLRGQQKYFLLVALSVGLGMHFESAFAIFLIPMTLLSLFFSKRLPTVRAWIISCAILIIVVSNFILFDLRHQFLMTKSVVHLFTGHVSVSKTDAQYKNPLIRLDDRLYWFLVTVKSPLYSDTLLNQVLLVLIYFAGIVAIIINRITKKKFTQEEKELVFFVLLLLGTFILYLVYPFSLEEHYIQSLNILVIFILGLCVATLRKYRLGLLVTAILIIYNLLPVVDFIHGNYFPFPANINESDGNYKAQLAAADAVFHDAKGRSFGYLVYEAPIVTYGMDYLMWWRGKSVYHFIPDSLKHPLTYLIMLPQPTGDLHAHDFWIKNTVRTKGKAVLIKKVAGNIQILRLDVPPNDPPADPNYYQNLIFR